MLFAAIFLLPSVFSAPALLHTVHKYSGTPVKDNYIVTFKAGIDKSVTVSSLGSSVRASWGIVNGFAGEFDDEALTALRSNPDIESIYEDGILYADTSVIQTNAPWGLARISQAAKLSSTDLTALNYTYTYDDSAGTGVDIYMLDSGILTTHEQFGGRAKWAATFGVGYADADGNGHGTHTAGTAGGSQFGVAKNATLLAVKVLNDKARGQWADMISGLDFVATAAAASGRLSVASMSVSGGGVPAADAAVEALVASGVAIALSAGNSAIDAATVSPARTPSALTVGASNITDAIADFSNFGAVVDIFAPGVLVTSSWIGNNTATNTLSGTSMSAPHVAGVAAYVLGLKGAMSPADLADTIKSMAAKGVLTGIPNGTVNYLLSNNIDI